MAVVGGPPPAGGGYAPQQRVRFEAISEAWALFQQQASTWVLSALIVGVAIAIIYFLVMVVMVGAMVGAAHVPSMGETGRSASPFFAMFSFTGIIAGLLMYVLVQLLLAGLIKMAIKQIKGEPIAIGDITSALDVLPAVIGASIVIGIITTIGSYLCVVPGLVAGGLLMLAIPLIVDHRAGAMESLSMSFDTLKSEWLMATLFFLVVYIIIGIGAIPCGLGLLVTIPLGLLSIAVIYRDNFLGGASIAAAAPPTYTPPPPVQPMTPPAPPAAPPVEAPPAPPEDTGSPEPPPAPEV